MNDLETLPYHSPPNTPRRALNDLKMLCEIGPGQVVLILGRWLQPFCSHATYRVRVTRVQLAGNRCRRIHGTLVDFQDSPVTSMCLSDQQMLRVDLSAGKEELPKLSREDIERIVKSQGVPSMTFQKHSISGDIYVVGHKYLRSVKNEQGKRRSEAKNRSLGPLAKVELMSEEDLAFLVRSKFDLEIEEESLPSH